MKELEIEKDDFCEACALEGHLELLNWGREHGCAPLRLLLILLSLSCSSPHRPPPTLQGCPWDSVALINATRRGHLEITKYLWGNNCDAIPEDLFWLTGSRGHVHIFDYLHEKEVYMGGLIGDSVKFAGRMMQNLPPSQPTWGLIFEDVQDFTE
jgi:hypothetical protein